ncbi:MAG: HAD-superfamily hydrolase, subfamily variant 3 [Clostridiales bacterium]|jgi:HAD superfamily hydrolase (TIGR01509 family)|nr:HAD-superfamily hydrolase, subfamily variant 3 [Clostridiales bacterium]
MLKAVLFDMDGVIVDSEPMHGEAVLLTLKDFGIYVEMEFFNQFIGSTNIYLWGEAIKEFNLDTTVEELLKIQLEKKRLLIEKDGHQGIEGITELVKDLKKNGIKLAVASSSALPYIKEVITKLGLLEYFDELVSGEDVPNPKPAPDVFYKAAKVLGVEASECVVIEDSKNGVNAAKNAGMPCIGFINLNSGNQDLSNANILIEGFEEVDFKFVETVYKRKNGEPVIIGETK